jgi:hypothetical protein
VLSTAFMLRAVAVEVLGHLSTTAQCPDPVDVARARYVADGDVNWQPVKGDDGLLLAPLGLSPS